MKFKPGDVLPTAAMEAVTGEAINLPDPERLVHLQFRRFVDCSICNTHIAEFKKRAREIEAAGVKEVIVFHCSPKSICSYQKDVPFLMVGDAKKVFYKEFGVETSLGLGVSLPEKLQLKLVESKFFKSGCVALHYSKK